MDFVKHPSNIDSWTPATDEGVRPPIPAKPSIEGIPTPSIDSVVAVPKNGSVFLRVTIDVPSGDASSVSGKTVALRYRLKDAGGGSPGEWVEQRFPETAITGGKIVVSTTTVPPDTLLQVQVVYITARGTYGTWSATEEVFSTADPTAPATPTALDWTSPNFSARAANATGTSGRTAYLVFKIGTTVQSFAAATLIDRLAASPGDVRYVQPTPVSGATRRLWCGAENGSGIANVTPAYIDVTFP